MSSSSLAAAIASVSGSFAMDYPSRPLGLRFVSTLFPAPDGGHMAVNAAYIIPFCFSFNQKALTIYSSLKRRDPQRWNYCVFWALLGVLTVYLIFGSFGYLSTVVDGVSLVQFNFFIELRHGLVFDCLRYYLHMFNGVSTLFLFLVCYLYTEYIVHRYFF